MTLVTTGSAPSDQATSGDDTVVIEHLSDRSCRDRLPSSGVGRYLTEDTDAPFLPVEYRIDGDGLVICVPDSHRVPSAAGSTSQVTIIIHGEGGRFGGPWTIAAKGRLTPLTDQRRLRRLENEESVWRDGTPRGRWFEIRGAQLEGHRVVDAAQR